MSETSIAKKFLKSVALKKEFPKITKSELFDPKRKNISLVRLKKPFYIK